MDIPKYRAWDKISKKMRAVNSIAFNSTIFESGDSVYGSPKVVNMWGWDIIEQKRIIIIINRDIEDVILMGYTGLKDKNNSEIYEGDIVLYCEKYYEVIFKNGQFYGLNYNNEGCICTGSLGYWNDLDTEYKATCLIVGNIYQHPELIHNYQGNKNEK